MTFVRTGPGEPYDFESVTVTDPVGGLTITKLRPDSKAPPISALLTLESAAIRYRLDGVDPTTSEGHVMASGDAPVLVGINALRNFKAIKDTGVDGTLKVTYFH